jgi:hypothetical protein
MYAAAIVIGAALTIASLSYFAKPAVSNMIATLNAPRYTAHTIARAERWNPDQWSFAASDTPTASQPKIPIEIVEQTAHPGTRVASWSATATVADPADR